jgi:adenosine deaminase
MFDTALTREYELLVERFGFSLDDLVQFTLRAIDASFLPDQERTAMRAAFEADADELANALLAE